MIPLSKTEADTKEFSEWLDKNKDELQGDFAAYLENDKSDWIKQKYREHIQVLLFKTSYEQLHLFCTGQLLAPKCAIHALHLDL